MKKVLFFLGMTGGTFLIQVLFSEVLPFSFVRPDLMLIFVVSIGFMRGKRSGLLTGFFAGLCMDLYYGENVGLLALLYMYIGFFNGYAYKVFFDEDSKAPLLLTAVSSFAFGMMLCIIRAFLNQSFDLGLAIKTDVIPKMVITIIFSLFFYKLYYAINRKLVAIELEEQQSPWLRK